MSKGLKKLTKFGGENQDDVSILINTFKQRKDLEVKARAF